MVLGQKLAVRPPSASEGENMTGKDVDNLFDLLGIFRPGDKHLLDQNLRNAWLLVLKPYAPEDVREAVAQYFRESSYWPDVTEIAKHCPMIPAKEQKTDGELHELDRKHWERQVKMSERYSEIKRLRREAGLPETGLEAHKAGISPDEYDRLVEAVGLGDEAWIDEPLC